ncbi:MAG: transglycosylase SLT domain-containing protein, partial [Methylococcales bacterium]|nr:transglycosylase SLT domain-containing protein [Methylococcales bacterium]
KQFKEKLRNKNRLLNPSLNIRYGTFYYKQLLNQFNGHYALAAAAYNAGPHRVNHWLPEAGWLPADIWVETIPFNETRGYVAAVMTYSLIYQQLINKGGLAMADLMHDVSHQY